MSVKGGSIINKMNIDQLHSPYLSQMSLYEDIFEITIYFAFLM